MIGEEKERFRVNVNIPFFLGGRGGGRGGGVVDVVIVTKLCHFIFCSPTVVGMKGSRSQQISPANSGSSDSSLGSHGSSSNEVCKAGAVCHLFLVEWWSTCKTRLRGSR